jgi:hypothetical protein
MNLKQHIKKILKEEISSELKKPFMRYEKLINKLVYDVFDEGICGLSWDVIKLHHREGISIRIILYFTHNSLEEFGYERYGQSKQELKGLIEDYLPKFDGIYIAYDTTKCGETHKEEETEGAGGYEAPAFEMEPDHVHFKHLYNESELPLPIRRRVNKIDKLVDVLLSDMYVDDYENEEQFFDGVIFELGWLVRNEDFGLHNVDWGDIYDYINEYRRDDINEYYREHQKDEMNESEIKERCWKGYTQKGMKTMFGKRYPNCVKIKKKKTMKESIRNILLQEVNKKYSKPTEKVDKLVYRWLDNYFDGSQIYKEEYWKYHGFSFKFCKNGREIADLRVELDDRSPDWGPSDKRPTNERSVKEVMLYIYPVMIDELITDIPVRKNYLLYLIEEWFEDTKLDEIQRGFNRNDLSLDYVSVFESKKRGDICVPPISKPEDIEMQEIMDYIKKTTLFSYEDMEENEEEEPGWIEDMYLKILNAKEQERLNQEDRDNNPEPFNDGY